MDYNFIANVSMLFKQWIIKFNNIKVLCVTYNLISVHGNIKQAYSHWDTYLYFFLGLDWFIPQPTP